jgi:exosome complex RNA-binding protein Rrp4
VLQLRQNRPYVLGLSYTKEGRQGNSTSKQKNRFRRQAVRKSQTLKQASFLGLNSINLCNFDLSQLIEGSSLTMPCIISKNGLRIKTRTLIDTGANGYIFIDCRLAEKASPITQYIEMNLHINGRKQSKQPMLLV